MRNRIKIGISLAVYLLLLSCATQSVRGPFQERGFASWYGRKFQRHKTASGEKFDMHALTAAHRSLPFGTIVRVKCPSTGKEIFVRINDRGPFFDGRILDLSFEAAKRLGIAQGGVVEIDLEVVG